jgi:hypothetical protein
VNFAKPIIRGNVSIKSGVKVGRDPKSNYIPLLSLATGMALSRALVDLRQSWGLAPQRECRQCR